MKKFLIVVLAVLLLAVPAYALEEFQFDKSKVVVGLEGTYEEKAIDDLNVLNIGIGSFIDGDLTVVTDDLKLNTQLATIGYQLSEQITPYVILGAAQLSYDQNVNGSLGIGSFDIGANLLSTEYREASFATGLGAKGDLLQVEGVTLGYDARWLYLSGKEKDESLAVLPDYTSISVDNGIDTEYNEIDLAALLSKKIDLKKCEEDATKDCKDPIIKSVTPYVGYRLSYIAMNVDSSIGIGPVSVGNESNFEGVNHDGLVGIGAAVNDNVALKVGAIIGENFGGTAAVSMKF